MDLCFRLTEDQAHQSAFPGRVVEHLDARPMQVGDLAHDRQAEPAAVDIRAQGPVEALEDAAAIFRGDTDAGILDLQHRIRAACKRTVTRRQAGGI